MPGVIEIRNLRNISKLRFDIPDRGVWLLAAGNGGGKTTLLACLRRIGHSNAFPIHFPSSFQSNQLDDHSRGEVSYEINGEEVVYAYRGERWTPRPRKNSNLFSKFGYSAVSYVGATADRITPRPEDFTPGRIKKAPLDIVNAANSIFETNKFSMLRTMNLTPGSGNEVFMLSLGGAPLRFHSEKQFSLGELCVLKLLRILMDVSNNGIIIIDELEMALHPRAQVNLLRYLEGRSLERSLTIIFSTHSITLLKSIDRRRIIYLEKQDDGEIKPIVGCFPTYAIGNIASTEKSLPDVMFYVEDLFARDMLEAFCRKFSDQQFLDLTIRPTIKIVPVGPFSAVVAFLGRNRAVLPSYVTQKAILDRDVADEVIVNWRERSVPNHSQLAKFSAMQNDIDFLPFTPEVGLMDYAFSNLREFERSLRELYGDHQIHIGQIVNSYDTALSGSARRRDAKDHTDRLINYLVTQTQRSADVIRDQICLIFANLSWGIYKSQFTALLSPLLR